jgi:hypothetical protein
MMVPTMISATTEPGSEQSLSCSQNPELIRVLWRWVANLDGRSAQGGR